MLNYAGKAGDIRRRLMIVSRLGDSSDLEAVRGANYVIGRGWWHTTQARRATTVDDG